MKLTRLLRNKKAISPIFATLILIAIAVIAGIVVYMFTSGTIASMTGGGTAGQEKVAVQGVDPNAVPAVAYAQNTGDTPVTITSAIVKDASGNILTENTVTVNLAVGGALSSVQIDLTGAIAGQSYTVTLVSSNGGSFVSSSFVAP